MPGTISHPQVFAIVNQNVWMVLGALLLSLTLGTLVRVVKLARARHGDEIPRQRVRSLTTWWVLFVLLSSIVLLGLPAAVIVFALASLQGLREYRGLMQLRVSSTRLWGWAFVAVPMHYGILYTGNSWLFYTFIPVWLLGIILINLVLTGRTSDFIEQSGNLFLGLMLIVFLLSHAALVMSLSVDKLFPAGATGLFVYLIVLTECNDIAQALWGRRFGRRKIVPIISPNKTWEGWMLGAATTVALAVSLAPVLTPFSDVPKVLENSILSVHYLPALLVGLLIAVGGFFGDITISAIKREVGVKDSGQLLPGQGGILDRVDSLIFTAPMFFYFTFSLYL